MSLVFTCPYVYAQEPVTPADTIPIYQPEPEIEYDSLEFNLPEVIEEQQEDEIPEAVDPLAETDSVQMNASKIKTTGIGVYFDYLHLIGQLINDHEKYECGINIIVFKKFSLVGEGGIASLRPKTAIKNGTYLSEGTFWKAGLDYILNYNREKESRIYLGFRYAQSSYSDEGRYEVASHLWPSYFEEFKREDFETSWYEVTFGTEGRLFNGLYTGWVVRYKMAATIPDYELYPIYSIPGYGSGSSKSNIAFNFYLKYLISW